MIRNDQERIDAEASAWLVAIEETSLAPHQERDFAAWCAASRRHAATYAEMRETWGELATLDGLAHLVPVATPTARPRWSAGHRRWRTSGIALGAIAAAAIAFVAVPPELYRPSLHYATALGEVRSIRLPDGSRVVLGAKSTIAVRFSNGERRVALIGGEAYFDVVHNAARPFVVTARDATVRDIGTRFNVNVARDSVRISVSEGLVEIVRATAAAPKRLRAGQRAELLAATPTTPIGGTTQPIAVLAAPSPVAWREGRLVYDDVRLADLVADVNRYYRPGVTLATPATGELRVTASFRTSEIPAFMSALAATLPTRVDRDTDGHFALRAAR